MATDAGPVSGSGKAARALGRRALLALALAALLPAAALAQSADADGMIVIPGRGESAETALANANAHGVNTSAPRGSTSLNSYSAAELRGAYGGGSAVANGTTSANDIVLAGSAPGAAPRPAMAAGANPNPGGMAGTRAVEVLSGGEAAMRAAASADPDANRPEPPLYPSRRATPGAQPANIPARPGAAQPSQDAATYAADYAAGYAAGIAAARRAAQAAPAGPAAAAAPAAYRSAVYRAPGGAAAVPAQAGASLRAAFAPPPAARAQQVAPVVAQDVAPPHPAGPAAVATLRQPVAGILRVSTRAALPPAGDTATGAAPAQAQAAPPVPEGQQDPEAIRQAALAFLRQQTAGLPGKAIVTVAPAFPRGLAACTGLEPFLPTGARLWGRTTVGVRCAGAKPWTLYLQSKISVQGTYYVAARALSPGEVLTAADLVAHDGDLTQLPLAIITDPGQAVGGTSLVRVAAGLPLRQDMLRSAASVTIGQTVRVVAAGKGFTISSEGSVMNNAGPGQQVRVRLAAGQIVTAVVKDSGTVEIPL
ncbi:flagellar basal body P-ring formation chaperone FlgA [Burkholderia gladioli]|uniref:flagellar basal body P-ring formation chaperone FlgA n=1 Tax=Burkholderia gladioli TaxID=28095 RepID=UPI0022D14518|nr:flagellar basal body P-ring formation chaperone FlgA [Burkholderia gladioli]MDA0601954.1 flagellar basal body P-ring formation chaperone FlgA [Burkholderia gladioli]